MATHKTHIPGFGNWDVANNNVVITEYFDIARAGREKREGNGNKHDVSHSKRGPGIQKSLNIVDDNADMRNEKKLRFAQRGGDNTSRQTEGMPRKPLRSCPYASGAMRANDSGQVLMHQVAVNPSTASQKLAVHQRVPVAIRPTKSAPLEPKAKEVYQIKSGTKKQNYQRGLRSTTEMAPSPWVQKEYGGSRTPSPSSNRPSNVRKEFGRSGTPSPSPIRSSIDKISSSKNQKNKPLPKFGDWDPNDPASGIAFTSIFNKARNEKKGAVVVNKNSSQTDPATPIDEDLYKPPNYSHKKHGEKLVSILSKIFRGKMICK